MVDCFDRAQQQAAEADKWVTEERSLGPLHGVPITVKDSLQVAGLPTTWGLTHQNQLDDRQDAEIVQRLRLAGAIVLGKSNIPQLAFSYECDNPRFGCTHNPRSLDRTTGGSSGGEAALVASGCSPLGVGSDSAGSIRVPAHFCGVHSLMPTPGLLPVGGLADATPGRPHVRQTGAFMARHVEDLVCALNVTRLQPPGWTDCRPMQVKLDSLRIGVIRSDPYCPATPAITRTVDCAAKVLAATGAELVDFPAPNFRALAKLLCQFQVADGTRSLKRALIGSEVLKELADLQRIASAPRLVRWSLARSARQRNRHNAAELISSSHAVSVDKYWQMLGEVRVHVDRYHANWRAEKLDALIMPTCAVTAPRHGKMLYLTDAVCYSFWVNLFGWPAGVFSAEAHQPVVDLIDSCAEEQLPIGVQVVTEPWHEQVLSAVMLALESADDGALRESYGRVS